MRSISGFADAQDPAMSAAQGHQEAPSKRSRTDEMAVPQLAEREAAMGGGLGEPGARAGDWAMTAQLSSALGLGGAGAAAGSGPSGGAVVQRKAGGAPAWATPELPPGEAGLTTAANAAKAASGAGSAVEPEVASRVGAHLGADLSGVRVHSDPAAQQASAAMGARAFAYGSDVFLGPGEHGGDLGLMAHELTHVVQQGAAAQQTPQRAVTVGAVGGAAERQADEVAAAVTSGAAPAQRGAEERGTPTSASQGGEPRVQRQEGHRPGSDYSGGRLRERSFVRGDDLQTTQQQNGRRVFFENGAQVTLVRTHATNPAWIQVTGPAMVDTPQRPTAIPEPVTGWIQRVWTDMTLGVFADLGVTDRSDTYGALGRQNLPEDDVGNIVLHQTGGSTQQGTLNTYSDRIANNGSIGAQYLIGETGEISSITGIDRRLGHVAPDLPGGVNAGVDNSHSVGIEHVGRARAIPAAPRPPAANAPAAAQQAWATEMQRVRADLRALPLAPALRDRLMAMNDRTLFRTMADSGWNIYVDINGAQKRSSHLLTQRLLAHFGLQQGDIYAHEEVQRKTIGEGENIREFLEARQAYPGRVARLRELVNARTPAQRPAPLTDVVRRETELLLALAADATAAENAQLTAERTANDPGAASQREAVRVSFYNRFWERVRQLNALIEFLEGPTSSNLAQLTPLLAPWRN